MARLKKIDETASGYFSQHFRRSFPLKLRVAEAETSAEELEKFTQRKEQEEREIIEQMMASVPEEELANDGEEVRLVVGYDIREEPTPIMQIQEEEKKITVQGTIFGLDVKELRNGSTLFTFNLTDFSDSLAMKMFAKTKEDVKVLSLLANGKWVKARGRVEYDRFMQEPELVMMPSDLHEVKTPRERTDEARRKEWNSICTPP